PAQSRDILPTCARSTGQNQKKYFVAFSVNQDFEAAVLFSMSRLRCNWLLHQRTRLKWQLDRMLATPAWGLDDFRPIPSALLAKTTIEIQVGISFHVRASANCRCHLLTS